VRSTADLSARPYLRWCRHSLVVSRRAPADVSVLRIEKGKFGFVDSLGGRLEGRRKLECELSVRNGLVVWDLNGISREDWKKMGPFKPTPEWDGTLPLKR
jgi:hypothetical protein